MEREKFPGELLLDEISKLTRRRTGQT